MTRSMRSPWASGPVKARVQPSGVYMRRTASLGRRRLWRVG